MSLSCRVLPLGLGASDSSLTANLPYAFPWVLSLTLSPEWSTRTSPVLIRRCDHDGRPSLSQPRLYTPHIFSETVGADWPTRLMLTSSVHHHSLFSRGRISLYPIGTLENMRRSRSLCSGCPKSPGTDGIMAINTSETQPVVTEEARYLPPSHHLAQA
jgi:hypothetical protein